jgi:hypothetical protein
MMYRLGEVLWLVASGLAFLIAIIAVALAAYGLSQGDYSNSFAASLVLLVISGVVWLIGRAIRYIFSGY